MNTFKFLAFGFFTQLAFADGIATDGTMGAAQTLTGANVTIPQTLGTTVGNNLFHSFADFNINSGQTATFTGGENLQNVISRVTGGKVSNIDGLLRSQVGNADFYFINPAGMIFGKDAKLDVPASFYASTANGLHFKDGLSYDAMSLQDNKLSISTPEQFGLLESNALNNDLLAVNSSNLTVNAEQTLGLASDNIKISNAELDATEGKMIVAATNQVAITNSFLSADGNGRGQIAISGKEVTIDNSSLTASNIGTRNMSSDSGVDINTTSLNLINGSQISSDSYDAGNAGVVNVKSTESINVQNGSIISSNNTATGKGGTVNINTSSLNLIGNNKNDIGFTGIVASSIDTSTSQAGQVNVNADSINIESGAQMNSSTFGKGDANTVTVTAKNLTIDGKGNTFNKTGIGSSANLGSSGHAGNIVVATDNVLILNGGSINSATFGLGNAGSVQVDAKNVSIDSQNNQIKETGISSNSASNAVGNAGEISVNAQQLTIKNAGIISSNSRGSGQGGRVDVRADNIVVDGKGSADNLPTGIFSNARGTGNAGSIDVNSSTITLAEKGRIASNTYGKGNGGSVNVHAKNLSIDGHNSSVYTGIASNTYEGSEGDAGTIKVNASNITIEDAGRITTNTRGQGKAGSLVVNAENINIDAKNSPYLAGIAAAASPESGGQIGNVDVSATNKLVIKNDGQISIQNRATVEHPEKITAGTISVKAGDVYLQNALINAQSTGNIDASNIRAQILRGLWMNNSSITMQANSGNGGAISMDSGTCIDMFSSAITTSVASSTGNGGNITVSTSNLVLDDGAVQANAYSGNGGDVLLKIDSLIGSRGQVQQGGKKIDIGEYPKTTIWNASSNIRNVIQAASEFGLSGKVDVTSPQINLSGLLASLSTAQFDPNVLRQDYCEIGVGSSLTNKGYGALSSKRSDFLTSSDSDY